LWLQSRRADAGYGAEFALLHIETDGVSLLGDVEIRPGDPVDLCLDGPTLSEWASGVVAEVVWNGSRFWCRIGFPEPCPPVFLERARARTLVATTRSWE
jgi:hypothetical protein